MLTWEKLWKEQYNLIYDNCIKIASIKATYDPRINREVWFCICDDKHNILKASNLKDAKIEAIQIVKNIIPEIIKEEQKKKDKKMRKIEELLEEIAVAERNIEKLQKVMKEL